MKSTLKKLYGLIPFKRELFIVVRKVWRPKANIYRHLHFKGIIRIPVEETSFRMRHYGYEIENEVFWTGITGNWEKVSIGLWIKLCRNADVVFDIGANTGIYALISKAINPQAKVYAFEPVARVFEKLERNIKLNNFDIIPVPKAVSNADGTAVIYDTDAEHTYSVTVNKNHRGADVEVIERKIETVTLDKFIKDNGIQKLDLVKIGVEIHEPEVIEGFAEYIAKFKPSILIEIIRDEVAEKVNAMVSGLGYQYYHINENGGIGKADKIVTGDYYNYLLCTPETAASLGINNN